MGYVFTREPKVMPQQPPKLETQINAGLAVRRYLATAQRAQEAQQEFAEACEGLRLSLRELPRFVIEQGGSHYLVATDDSADLVVEQVFVL